MRKIAALLSLALLLACCAPAFAQKRWKQKEKRFEPTVKEDARDYAGRYLGAQESDWLDVRVGPDGRLAATLWEDGSEVPLRDLRLDGPHLTATKVYADNSTAPFSAVFANRILNGQTAFGLVVERPITGTGGLTGTRIFYRQL